MTSVPPVSVRGVQEVELAPGEIPKLGLLGLRGAGLLSVDLHDGSHSAQEGTVFRSHRTEVRR